MKSAVPVPAALPVVVADKPILVRYSQDFLVRRLPAADGGPRVLASPADDTHRLVVAATPFEAVLHLVGETLSRVFDEPIPLVPAKEGA